MNQSFIMVVPTISKDVGKLLANVDLYFSFLPIYKICVIGNDEVVDLLPSKDRRIDFCDENSIINRDHLHSYILKRLGSEKASFRFGWYYQQFLKMAYSYICPDEYYLLWDSDTIPVKEIELFSSTGLPFFDYKTEYHKPYFDTIRSILPGLEKIIKGSFIAEHMLVKVSFMRSLIDEIEKCNDKGVKFEEIIINSIPEGKLSDLSFSEFETYGSFVTKFYPETYALREWKSMRFGGFFFNDNLTLSSDDLLWLSSHYDAISFEKTDHYTAFGRLVQFNYFKRVFPSSVLILFSVIIRGVNKLLRLN